MTMSAQALYQAGELQGAVEALGNELRSHPTDAPRRIFLFELLSFAGECDRAVRQLDVLAQAGQMAEAGTLTYRAAITAERVREHMFDTGDFPSAPAPSPVAGTLNGEPFASITDADPRVGARLEVMAGGRYLWIPFAHLATVTLEPPARLRDLHWAPALVTVGPALRDQEFGEILLPVLSRGAWRHGGRRRPPGTRDRLGGAPRRRLRAGRPEAAARGRPPGPARRRARTRDRHAILTAQRVSAVRLTRAGPALHRVSLASSAHAD